MNNTPQDPKGALKDNCFIPDRKTLVLFAGGLYHKSWKQRMTSKGKTYVDRMMRGVRQVKQGQANLTSVYGDV